MEEFFSQQQRISSWVRHVLFENFQRVLIFCYFAIVWEALAVMNNRLYIEVEVEFEDVKFIRATGIPSDTHIDMIVMINHGTGRFEVFLVFLKLLVEFKIG